MAETNISWARWTFNGWVGCTKVSPACDRCYAAEWAARYEPTVVWGVPGRKSKLRHTAESTWTAPRSWNRTAERERLAHGRTTLFDQGATPYERPRVFAMSLADWADKDAPDPWRAALWQLIRETPELDWLLLTKRPQNIAGYLPPDWGNGYPNVWMGTTAENQTEYERRRPHLLDVPAVVHFFSVEPMLQRVDIEKGPVGDWYIVGGESGKGYRALDLDGAEKLRRQCADRGVAYFFKQDSGVKPGLKGRAPAALWDTRQMPKVRELAA